MEIGSEAMKKICKITSPNFFCPNRKKGLAKATTNLSSTEEQFFPEMSWRKKRNQASFSKITIPTVEEQILSIVALE